MSNERIVPALGSPVDYKAVFENIPAAQMITRQRIIVECNAAFAGLFDTPREALIGQSVRVLYPNQVDFERFGKRVVPILAKYGVFSDSRVMKRASGSLFWVHVAGFSQYRDNPYSESLWVFSEIREEEAPTGKILSAHQLDSRARGSMTGRERDVASLLIQNKTAKEIGRELNISPRTVEVYRTRLLRKFDVASTSILIERLLS